jgi:PAS domain S-box-containing protein
MSSKQPDRVPRQTAPGADDSQNSDAQLLAASANLVQQREQLTRDKEALTRRAEELTDFIENATIALHWVGPDGRILWANKAELDLLGYTREEYIGHHISEFHADGQVIDDILRRLVCHEELHAYEARLRAKDGSIRHVRLSSNVLWKGEAFVHTRCFTHDVTEQTTAQEAERDVERQLMLLVEASGALLASPQTPDVLLNILNTATTFIDADAYAVWRKQSTDGAWKLITSTGLSDEYERTTSEQAAGAGQSLPREPTAIEDVETFPLVQHRAAYYRAEGIRSMLTIPMSIHGELGGTIVFYHRKPHRFAESELRLGAALGNLAAAALGTAELYSRQVELRSEAERLERRASFLAEAGAVLGSSLDYEATLARVAEAAVPILADWCTVDLLDESGRLRSVALAHQNPAKVEFAREFRRKYEQRDTDVSFTALRTGQPVLFEEIIDEMLVQGARSDEHLRDLRALELRSFIIVPLVAGGRALGTLTFVSAESRHRYTAADLQFAEQLGARAATAIDNARLHADVLKSEQRTAFLLHLDDSIRPLSDPDDITRTAARILGEHLGVNRCAYANVEADEDTFNLTGDYNRDVPSIVGRYTFTQFGAECLRLMRAGQPYSVTDSETDPRTDHVRESYRLTLIRSVICVSILKQGQFVAAMAVHQMTPREWRKDEVELVQQVASRCWESIERSRVSRELHDSQARLRAIYDGTYEYIGLLTPNGILTEANRASLEFAGNTREEVVGRAFWDTPWFSGTPGAPEVVREAVARAAAGEFVRFEATLRRPSGEFLTFDISLHPIRNESGEVVLIVPEGRDLTERKQAEQALRGSEARFRAAVTAVSSLIWTNTPEGQMEQEQPGWAAFTGQSYEEYRGYGWAKSVHPDDAQPTIEAWNKAVAESRMFLFEHRVRRHDGVYRLFSIRAVPVIDENGAVHEWVGVHTDITELKQAEDERTLLLLREQEARHTAELLNRIGPALAAELDTQKLTQSITDIATRLTGAQFGALFHTLRNEHGESFTLYTLSGVDREAFAGFPMPRNTHVFGPTFRNEGFVRSEDILQDPRYGKNPPYGGMPEGHLPVRSYLAVSIVSRSGEVLGGLFFGHPEPGRFSEAHEQIVGGIAAQAAIALDNARLFTEAQRTQNALMHSNEELRRANADLEQFAYSASHDLKEPLRMVAIYSQLLKRKYHGQLDAEADGYLDITMEGATRMQALVSDLFNYTQAATTTLTEPVNSIAADAVLNKALLNLKSAVEESGAKINRAPLPKLLLEETHLLLLFQNVVGNAIKYRGEKAPVIGISAEREGNLWRISVYDNGIGIQPEYQDQVFGIFKRLHTSDRYSGTGMGLAICQKIVHRYGGRIWVESKGAGQGSTFCFTLPGEE